MAKTPDVKRLREQLQREEGPSPASVAVPFEAGWWACWIDLFVPGLGHLLQRRYVTGALLIGAILLFKDFSTLNGAIRIGAAISSLVYGLNRHR